MRVGLAILNRNEKAGLKAILPIIALDSVERVIAIDGASTDGSPALLREHGVEVLGQTSMGRGEAFRLAFDSLRDDVDAIIFFSPDGNEDPADIPRFRACLESGSDVVIASRMMDGATNEEDAHWWRPRKWANLAFDSLAWTTWGRSQPKITDAINGYRAFTVDAWDRLDLDASGFAIEYQSSIRSYKLGLTVTEFPTTEGKRIGGASDAHSIPTGLRFVKLYLSELRRRPPSRTTAD